jgi:DNA-directed RNA polymerase specialized sigma24 family protein
MEQNRGEGVPGRPGEALAVQPRVVAEELAGFADRDEAKRLQRLLADQEIMLRLSVEGFGGKTWQTVAEALVAYAWAVMEAWVATGQVFRKCREKGLGGDKLVPPPGGIPPEEARQLAYDTVADALINFRDQVLKKGRWNPAKGATLSTYFVGNCLLRFVNRYRSWRTRWTRLSRSVEYDSVRRSDERPDPADTVVDLIVGTERAAKLLEPIGDSVNRAIITYDAQGYGVDEIAEIMSLPYKAVEARLYRARRSLRETWIAEGQASA